MKAENEDRRRQGAERDGRIAALHPPERVAADKETGGHVARGDAALAPHGPAECHGPNPQAQKRKHSSAVCWTLRRLNCFYPVHPPGCCAAKGPPACVVGPWNCWCILSVCGKPCVIAALNQSRPGPICPRPSARHSTNTSARIFLRADSPNPKSSPPATAPASCAPTWTWRFCAM